MTTKSPPKIKQTTIDHRDLGKAFPNEKVLGRDAIYRITPPYRYGYGYDRSRKNRIIRLGDDTIRGEWNATVDQATLAKFMKWLETNTVWHSTEFRPVLNGGTSRRGVDYDVPVFSPSQVMVHSIFHRKMTPAQKTDLAAVTKAKTERVAKEKEATKRKQAEARKAARAAKAEREALLAKAQAKRQETEFTDLAQALKVLKKHGLKIVTVDEARGK